MTRIEELSDAEAARLQRIATAHVFAGRPRDRDCDRGHPDCAEVGSSLCGGIRIATEMSRMLHTGQYTPPSED